MNVTNAKSIFWGCKRGLQGWFGNLICDALTFYICWELCQKLDKCDFVALWLLRVLIQSDVLNDKALPVFFALGITDFHQQKLSHVHLLLPLPFAFFTFLFSRFHLDNLLYFIPYLFNPIIVTNNGPYHIFWAPFRCSSLLAILESYSCAGSSMLVWGLPSCFIFIITINRRHSRNNYEINGFCFKLPSPIISSWVSNYCLDVKQLLKMAKKKAQKNKLTNLSNQPKA